MSDGEIELAWQLKAMSLVGKPETEYVFARPRRWRFDFAWPASMLAVEVEGGVWLASGHHSKGRGFEADCEKYNEAMLLGWRVLRVTPAMVSDGRALAWIERALA